jgi:hypothetical protein
MSKASTSQIIHTSRRAKGYADNLLLILYQVPPLLARSIYKNKKRGTK